MDPTRASKRRKLDSPSQNTTRDSSPSSTIHVTCTNNAVANTDSIPPSPAAQHPKPRSTQELWKEAKAKKQRPASQRSINKANRTQRQQQQEAGSEAAKAATDVYDDLDGANGETRSPVKRKQGRKTLDPLRNQVDVTPKKGAGVGGGSLGFFKQFLDKGQGGGGSSGEGAGIATQKALHSQLGVSRGRGVVNGRSDGVGSAGKAKTFEDEIREVERRARREAAGKDEPELTLNGRSSGRRGVVNGTRLSSQPAEEESPFYRSGSRPRQEAAPARGVQVDEDQAGDPTEIDESDHEIFVQQREVPAPKPKPRPMQQDWPTVKWKSRTSVVIENGDAEAELSPVAVEVFQRVLLDKITRRRPIALTSLEDEYSKVSTVINQTITAGESNSMLLIGARGSGKTTLVNQILRKHSVEHPDDFLVVRLDGFIHTDDKIALREIWRQLGRGMELDEEEMATKSYADTLATLLALLSHQEEQGLEEQPGQVTKSVIFVMDEFDLFATHPRQTLLYNLFDIAQSRKAPIAVLGLTTRVDVAESLEKRVKSRFSHRYVHLSLPRSFAMFQGICQAAINIEQDDLKPDEKSQLEDHPQALPTWSTLVDNLLNTPTISTHLRRIYYTTKSIPDFFTLLHLPLSTIPPIATPTIASHLLTHLSTPATPTHPPDSKLSLLPSLSTLHLALLISAARLTTLYNTPTVSFALVYEEYKVLASKMKVAASASGALAQGAGGRVWGKGVARGVWEGLGEMGLLLLPAGRVDVGLEEIGAHGGVELGSWGRWCREI